MITTNPTSTDPTMPSHYPSSQTALLLLDFHAIFVEKVTGSKGIAALAVATAIKKWAKTQGIHIIHCLVDMHSTPFPTCKGAVRLSSLLVNMQESSGGVEAAPLQENSEGEATFTRRVGHVSALKSPGLLEYLKEKGIKSLVLTGLSTSGCVLRTAAAACDEDFVVSVLEDGCADSEQTVHDAVVGKVLTNRGYVYTSDAFREGWEKGNLGK